MAIGVDSPAWTFGLNPKIPEPRVPGPGTYDVAGRLGAGSVGTRFTRAGAKPSSPRTDGSRLVFDTEEEDRQKPGPGAYNIINKRPLRRWNGHPGGAGTQTPRFPESVHATDAGPGAFLSSDFVSGGPAYSLPARQPTAFDAPGSPGPGQYIKVQLNATREKAGPTEGFGKRDSARFDAEQAHTPGPGEYRSTHFQPQTGKNITFGGQFRPPGWSVKVKEITRFACERNDDGNGNGSEENSGKRCRFRFRGSLERRAIRNSRPTARVRRRPSSAPPSSRFRRACARGRRLENSSPCSSPRSIADVVKEAGRRRTGNAAAASAKRASCDDTGRGAVIGSTPQRPPDPKRTPSPSTYTPVTLDEAARNGKVVGIGSKSKRELFTPSPDTPGPEPGVGEYDLRAAERFTSKSAAAVAPTLGHRPTGAPFDPGLNRYLHADGLETPSVHAYRPESVKGGVGKCGRGGRAAVPPAWSFGRKRKSPRPPDGPGPGRFRPPGNDCSSAGFGFGAGREVLSGFVTGVPWVEVEEQAARGDGSGGDAKLYLPERNRVGARAFMRSRHLPRPRK
ncbi:unnamed protein product [Hapterophycus canaliculatus]